MLHKQVFLINNITKQVSKGTVEKFNSFYYFIRLNNGELKKIYKFDNEYTVTVKELSDHEFIDSILKKINEDKEYLLPMLVSFLLGEKVEFQNNYFYTLTQRQKDILVTLKYEYYDYEKVKDLIIEYTIIKNENYKLNKKALMKI